MFSSICALPSTLVGFHPSVSLPLLILSYACVERGSTISLCFPSTSFFLIRPTPPLLLDVLRSTTALYPVWSSTSCSFLKRSSCCACVAGTIYFLLPSEAASRFLTLFCRDCLSLSLSSLGYPHPIPCPLSMQRAQLVLRVRRIERSFPPPPCDLLHPVFSLVLFVPVLRSASFLRSPSFYPRADYPRSPNLLRPIALLLSRVFLQCITRNPMHHARPRPRFSRVSLSTTPS